MPGADRNRARDRTELGADQCVLHGDPGLRAPRADWTGRSLRRVVSRRRDRRGRGVDGDRCNRVSTGSNRFAGAIVAAGALVKPRHGNPSRVLAVAGPGQGCFKPVSESLGKTMRENTQALRAIGSESTRRWRGAVACWLLDCWLLAVGCWCWLLGCFESIA